MGVRSNLTLSTKLALSRTRDETSRNFVLHGETKEEVGGILWTFWRLCDGNLLSQEGLWFSRRLAVVQVAQVVVVVILTLVFFLIATQAAQAADDYRDDLANDDLPDWDVDIFPTGAMVEASLIPAAFVALAIMICTVIVYVPRYVPGSYFVFLFLACPTDTRPLFFN